jgi:hypothetical protein
MKSEKIIINCPNCGIEIEVNEILYHQLEEQVKRVYEKKVAEKEKELRIERQKIQEEKEKVEKEKERIKEIIDREVKDKLNSEKTKIAETLRKQIENEFSEHMKELQRELSIKSAQVKDLHKAKAEIERLKREKDELREQITLEKEKEFSDRLKEEKIKIQKQLEEMNILKIKEKEKIIEDLKAQLDEAKRKAEQSSIQLQGEVQELELENLLRALYPGDEIREIKKGQRGADVLQIVKTPQGVECGKIYYESKRTKNFEYDWLQKLRDDNLEVKADILVLVTEKMPDGEDKFFFKDGVWICSFFEIKGLSLVLRHGLLQVYSVIITQQGKETKMEMLYNYLTSQEFRDQFRAIVEGFKSLQDSYQDEKLKMMKIWKEREKQLEKILINAVNFYGAIKGIAGASIPEIKMLESRQQIGIEQKQDTIKETTMADNSG